LRVAFQEALFSATPDQQRELMASYPDLGDDDEVGAERDVEKRGHILRGGWQRMENSPTQEHAAALIEIAKIANHRFEDLVADANPIHTARTQPFDQLDQ
jgi:uric acid transporter